jgi:hypothetical protein
VYLCLYISFTPLCLFLSPNLSISAMSFFTSNTVSQHVRFTLRLCPFIFHFSLSFSAFLSLSLSLFLSISLCLPLSVSLCLSLSFYISRIFKPVYSVTLFLSLSLSHFLSLTFYITISLFLAISFSHILTLSLYFSYHQTVSHLYLHLSFSISLSFSSVCLSVCLSLSLFLSLCTVPISKCLCVLPSIFTPSFCFVLLTLPFHFLTL